MRYFHNLGKGLKYVAQAAFGVEGDDSPPPFDAAGSGRRSSTWNPGADAIAALLISSGDTLRRKSRQLVRNNPWASGAIRTFAAHSVGTGIVPNPMHPDARIKQQIEHAWLRWTDDADASGQQDFYGLQTLACKMLAETGECFIRLRPRLPEDGIEVPLQLQLLESEQLPLAKNEDLPIVPPSRYGNKVRAGIEFDAIQRRVAYHFFLVHPYAGVAAMGDQTVTTRVPAHRVDPAAGALHLFELLRAGQLRGQPWMTASLAKLYQLDQFDDATLSKQMNLAFFMLAVRRASNSFAGVAGEEADDEGKADLVMEPNTLQYLGQDEELQEIGGKGPGTEYATFIKTQLHSVAAALGMTYEQLSGDLEGVTYSSIRQGVLDFRRKVEQFQHQVLVYQMCRPIWRSWMDAAVLSGALDLPGYASDPEPYRAVEWTPPPFPWVDPEAEVNAAIKEVRAGFNARADRCKEGGTDRATVDRKQAEDNASADEAGVVYDSDGRNPASGTAATPANDKSTTAPPPPAKKTAPKEAPQ